MLVVRVASLYCCIETPETDWTSLLAEREQNRRPHSKVPLLPVGYLSSISTRPAITITFAINSVIVIAICHILSAIYWNSNESSGSTSGCSGGIFHKIHNFHSSHTLHKRCKYGCER